MEVDNISEESEWEDDEDEENQKGASLGWSNAHADSKGQPLLIIVHSSGVHQLPVRPCSCPDAEPFHLQLLNLGMYPASQARPKTVFTFGVLDEFLMENRECKVSAMSFYSKLKRMTSNVSLHAVPDRYREFTRCVRQWRDLEARRRQGYAHGREAETACKGTGPLFCPACPQEGINISEKWKDESDR